MIMKIRKMVSIFLAVVLLFISLECDGLVTKGDSKTDTYIYAGQVEAEAGKTIEIPVYIKNNNGIMGVGVNLEYDETVLTPVSVTNGGLTEKGVMNDSIETAKTNAFKIIWASDSNVNGDGELFRVKFNVSDYARGIQSIKLTFSQPDTYNEQWKDVKLNCQDISINVKSPEYTEENISSEDNLQAENGKSIYIPVNISNNTGRNKITLDMKYDKNIFKFKNINKSMVTQCETQESEEGRTVILSGIEKTKSYGTLVTLEFEVSENADGKYNFDISSDDVITTNFQVTVNNNGQKSTPEIVQGTPVYNSDGTIDVPVMVTGNSGLMGYKLTVEYNKNEIEPVLTKNGDIFKGSYLDNIGVHEEYFNILWTGTEDIKQSGIMFTINVKPVTANKVTTTLNISYSKEDTFNEKWENVELKCNSIAFETSDKQDVEPEIPDISKYKVSGFKVKSYGSNTIRLKWNYINVADGYEVSVYRKKKWNRVGRVTGKNTSVSAGGLSGATKYKFKIKPYIIKNGKYVYGKSAYCYGVTKPAMINIKSVVPSKGKITVKWGKQKCTGYQIKYSASSSLKKSTVIKINNSAAYYKKISKLKSKKNYYIKMRSYVVYDGKTYYGAFGKTVKVKVK